MARIEDGFPAPDSSAASASVPESSAEQARSELEAALERGFGINFAPQGILASGRSLRKSAVLILFGALDRLPAGHSSAPVLEGVSSELDVLLTRRADELGHHPGQIAFPGGGVEQGDRDLVATALREAHEETGLLPSGVDVLGELPAIHIPVSNNLVTPVIGWWQLPSPIAADESESVDVFRIPVAEMLAPEARGMSVLRRADGAYRGAAFKLGPQYGGHIVWGFTGMLLSGIFDGVGWSVPWDRKREFEVLV